MLYDYVLLYLQLLALRRYFIPVYCNDIVSLRSRAWRTDRILFLKIVMPRYPTASTAAHVASV